MKKFNHIIIFLVSLLPTIGVMTALSSCEENLPPQVQEEPTEAPGGENGPEGETPEGPSEPTAPIVKSREISLTTAEKSLAEATIAGSFRLLRLQSETERKALEPKANMMISPLSLSWALSMVANGASGESQAEIIRGLGFEGYSMEEINGFFHKLYGELTTLDEYSTFNIAGSLWFRSDMKPYVLDSFAKCLSEKYNAPVDYVRSFETDEARLAINNWCDGATDGFIKELFKEQLSDDLFMILANVLYFKGQWACPFDSKMTKEATFHNEDGSCSTVRMMNSKEMGYEEVKGDGFHALKLPYGNEGFSMTVVLPDKGLSLEECMERMEAQSGQLTALAKGEAYLSTHIVSLPVFETEYECNFGDVLSNSLLIRKIFNNDEADLSSMFDVSKMKINRSLDSPIQVCKIAVDEEGTKASAVTIITGADCVNDNLYFTVDRPFVYVISERSTGLPIFMGRVTAL